MVQAGNDWKLWSTLAGGAMLGLAAWFLARRRRRRTLRQRLAAEIDLENRLEALWETVQELRERLPVHDGEVARSFWQRRVRPAVREAAQRVPERARRAQALLEAERAAAEKVQRDFLPATEQAARQAVQKAEQVFERAATQVRDVPQRLALKGQRPARQGFFSRVRQAVRESVALGFWIGAASALVYFGLLRPEQHEQLRRGASSLLTQLRELWADFSFSEEPLAEFTE